MSDSTYEVQARTAEIMVSATVTGGQQAYNTARAMAVAGARGNPGVEFQVLRDGRVSERYVGEKVEAVEVRKVGRRRGG